MKVLGGCHCGQVAFAIEIGSRIQVQQCNCSICRMLGFLHLIVPANRFELLTGSENLLLYRFNTGIAQHLFCGTCGVKSFYVPRSNPDGFSINLRCVALPETVQVHKQQFDGENWEHHAASLQHLSEPEG